jgi:hypothetical protein
MRARPSGLQEDTPGPAANVGRRTLGVVVESPYKGKTGLKRAWNALTYSLDGLSAAFRHEDAFRQEVARLGPGECPLAERPLENQKNEYAKESMFPISNCHKSAQERNCSKQEQHGRIENH